MAGSTSALSIAGTSEVQAQQARITRRMVIPTVDIFEDNYLGQFVFIDEATDTGVDDVPVGSCQFSSTWARDETQVYDGQLLDRHQEEPVAVDLSIYMDGNQEQINPGTHFIIQNTTTCDGAYIGLEGETVTRRALVGKAPRRSASQIHAPSPPV